MTVFPCPDFFVSVSGDGLYTTSMWVFLLFGVDLISFKFLFFTVERVYSSLVVFFKP